MSDSSNPALGQELEHLIRLAQGGDQRALGQLLQAFQRLLMAGANGQMPAALRRKEAASDLVQDTLTEAAKDFAQFKGATQHELRSWLCRILDRNLANLARKYATHKREVRRETPPPEGTDSRCKPGEPVAPGPSPSSVAARHEEEEVLARAMSFLTEEQRTVILLRHRDDLTFEDIGDRLGIGAEAARKRFTRAVERLRDRLEQMGHAGE